MRDPFGKIENVSLDACWLRDSAYYGRASRAGAYQRNGIWVMDSPANNARSHYINIRMFLLESKFQSSAMLVRVEAELYRANAIENFDTISCHAGQWHDLSDQHAPCLTLADILIQ